MQRMNRIHFWLGIIIAIGLLAESAAGIYMYVLGSDQQNAQRSFAQNMPNGFQGGFQGSGSGSNNSQSPYGGSGNFQNGGQRFRQFGNMRRARNFQTTVYGLIANIIALILSVAGLVASAIVARRNAKNRKELVSQE
ncbi:hypothetical protein E4665_08615 [Sporolactobacillus shoreae]|uniref:PepSY domain-containing protein n=1 Tax=Sporolactobacillus shoreae TaxID=1465501 RepID=A0A4Z0GPV3_9BACL|nr:hypothetical protein [Sporolactobacillus shoreae]TGA98298.1 hypothetical protein E4665_08615 [Sporolactobacillus shoreae]